MQKPKGKPAMEFTYSASGVDREARMLAKDFSAFEKGQKGLKKTPFQNLIDGGNNYSALLADGVGTKVLLAQLAGIHGTIGIDGVAMVANDAARAGLRPKFLVDIIDIYHSERKLIADLVRGIDKGAKIAGCSVVGGETADVPSLVKGFGSNPYNLNFSLYAEAQKQNTVLGTGLRPGDAIIGLRSRSIHSNGASLVRKILFSEWGGRYADPFAKIDGLDKTLVEECLTPTAIYAKEVCELQERTHLVKAAVHVTGDAYAKFAKLFPFNRGTGLSFDNFKPQPIFKVLQDAALKAGRRLSDEEMLRTFNMGWGFAVIVSPPNADEALGFFERKKIHCEKIGMVTQKEGLIEAKYKGKAFGLS